MEWLGKGFFDLKWLMVIMFIVVVVIMMCVATYIITTKVMKAIFGDDSDEEEEDSEKNNEMQTEHANEPGPNDSAASDHHHHGTGSKNCEIANPAVNDTDSTNSKNGRVCLERKTTVKLRNPEQSFVRSICWQFILYLIVLLGCVVCILIFLGYLYDLKSRSFQPKTESNMHSSTNGVRRGKHNPMDNNNENQSKQTKKKSSPTNVPGKENKKSILFPTLMGNSHYSVTSCELDEKHNEMNYRNSFASLNMKEDYLKQKQTSSQDHNCKNGQNIPPVDDILPTTEKNQENKPMDVKDEKFGPFSQSEIIDISIFCMIIFLSLVFLNVIVTVVLLISSVFKENFQK